MNVVRRSMLGAWLLASAAHADRQVIAPGTGLQSAVEVDSGANGICETKARGDDLQAAKLGQGAPFADEIRCGPDRIANTAAAGDDRQLIAVGSACGAREIVVDTGPDGIANSTAVGDDVQLIPVGSAAPNTPCVLTGANGLADTPDPAGGDDVRILLVGHAEPNTPVIRCGPNHVAETTANNVHAGGDDVQRVGVGASCPGTGTVVVDSGANGVAETRAQGAELVLRLATPRPLTIPFRCTVKVEADAVDTAPDPDDAANPANNAASVELDAVDLNDL